MQYVFFLRLKENNFVLNENDRLFQMTNKKSKTTLNGYLLKAVGLWERHLGKGTISG